MKIDTGEQAGYINKVVDFRKNIFDILAARDPGQLWLKASTKDVKRIIVIAAASRSGSSLLFSILKNIPCVYSLSGESVPFYKLNGFSCDYSLSDEVSKEMLARDQKLSDLSRDFLSNFSFASEKKELIKEKNILEQYIDDLALRFSLQWPTVNFSYDLFTRLARQAYEIYTKERSLFCVEEFYLELILTLKREYADINPYYYDIATDLVKKKFPALEVPVGPANNILAIEEAPFILLSPCKKPQKEDLFSKTLLLKSSADCYRLPFLNTIFPNAEIRIIYLTRNPFGSINGLYDGWLHRGFFSHNLSGILKNSKDELGISGYSDHHEWGKWWWNYDLPLGWQDYKHKKLEEVCAFQWYSANGEVQRYLRKDMKEYCLVRYENIISNSALRAAEINKILNFIGLNAEAVKYLDLDKLPIVQVTEPPEPYRWKKRDKMLRPFLDNPKISGMSTELGYSKDNIKEWF
jgi:hypothetical protein